MSDEEIAIHMGPKKINKLLHHNRCIILFKLKGSFLWWPACWVRLASSGMSLMLAQAWLSVQCDRYHCSGCWRKWPAAIGGSHPLRRTCRNERQMGSLDGHESAFWPMWIPSGVCTVDSCWLQFPKFRWHHQLNTREKRHKTPRPESPGLFHRWSAWHWRDPGRVVGQQMSSHRLGNLSSKNTAKNLVF